MSYVSIFVGAFYTPYLNPSPLFLSRTMRAASRIVFLIPMQPLLKSRPIVIYMRGSFHDALHMRIVKGELDVRL